MIRCTDNTTADDFINVLLMNDKSSDQSSVLPSRGAVNAVSPLVTLVFKYHRYPIDFHLSSMHLRTAYPPTVKSNTSLIRVVYHHVSQSLLYLVCFSNIFLAMWHWSSNVLMPSNRVRNSLSRGSRSEMYVGVITRSRALQDITGRTC